MKITFAQTYLSISNFPPTELPDFTLITGPNGAGKSHLLQALVAGSLKCDIAPAQGPHNPNDVRLFDWNSLVPQDQGMFTSDVIRNDKANTYNSYRNVQQDPQSAEPVRRVAREFSLPAEYLSDINAMGTLTEAQIQTLVGARHQAASDQLRAAEQEVANFYLQRIGPEILNNIRNVAQAVGKPLYALTQEDFISNSTPSWGTVSLFQQSFGRLFIAYRDLYLGNQLAQYRKQNGASDAKPISNEEFLGRNGPPPWDFVNQSLRTASLDFRINQPDLDDFSPFQPELSKLGTHLKIPFSALSSGEKVLMSFAFCVYYANDKRQIATKPRLLLLDEVDAPLHPSMSKNLIDTIQQTLVADMGIKVIATTHSPSTVALAPEEAIYVMKPGIAGLTKSRRDTALDVLTVGVPTLAISFDGRRQVFVESPADAITYDKLYRILKPRISSEKSLEFVATGTRTAQGIERNTGCEVVRRLVNSLADAGNISVFGLVDWDGTNARCARMAVLAEGKRNGLENLVLDPLAVALLIMRDFPGHRSDVGLANHLSFLAMAGLEQAQAQTMANLVTERVLGEPPVQVVKAAYVGGMELEVDERYFLIDDHTIEAKILGAFPYLQAVGKQQAGKLLQPWFQLYLVTSLSLSRLRSRKCLSIS